MKTVILLLQLCALCNLRLTEGLGYEPLDKVGIDTTLAWHPGILSGRDLTSSCGSDFKDSMKVVTLFNSTSSSWAECGNRLDPIVTKAEDVADVFDSVLSSVQEAQDATGSVLNISSTVHGMLKPVIAILSKIPKVGSVIDSMYKLLDKVIEVAEKANDKLGNVLEFLSKIKDAAFKFVGKLRSMVDLTGYLSTSTHLAARAINITIQCSRASFGCDDDKIVEDSNTAIVGAVNGLAVGSTTCPRVFEQYDKLIGLVYKILNNPVIKKIRETVKKIEDVVKLIRPPIEKAIDAVKKGYLKAYCCTASVATQFILNKVDDVLDFTSCATRTAELLADGILQLLVEQVNAYVADLVLDQIDLKDVGLVMGSVSSEGGSGGNACGGGKTSVVTQTFSPLQEFLESMAMKKLSPIELGKDFVKLLKEAGQVCEDAAKGLIDVKFTDCCKHFVPLSDGTFCDPTGNVPFRKCTQCTSNQFGWSFKKFSTVCGQGPCGKDGSICGKGTTCKLCCSKTSSFWWKKGFTACGKEPKWKDGEWCIPGLSCRACKNKATLWPSKAGYACGYKCWGQGAPCIGDLCKNCCQEAYTVVGEGKICGPKPCIPDKVPCLAKGICSNCCNKPGPGLPICGITANLPAGTPCAGEVCKACKNGESFKLLSGVRVCGKCLVKGVPCVGDLCDSCCSPTNSVFGVCGYKTCVPKGTPCVGPVCKACCSPTNSVFGVCGYKTCLPKGTTCAGPVCKACCSPTNSRFGVCGYKTCLPKGTPCAGAVCKACCSPTNSRFGVCGYKTCLPKGTPCAGPVCKACCSPTNSAPGFCGHKTCLPKRTPCVGDLCKICCDGTSHSIGVGRLCGKKCKITTQKCSDCAKECCTGKWHTHKKIKCKKWKCKTVVTHRTCY